MRFCPFCSAENADELAVCQSCGRRLPPVPPRRARNAPPTGVLLPPRSASTTQPPPVTAPRRATTTTPPPARPNPPSTMVTSQGLAPIAPKQPHAGLRGQADPHAATVEAPAAQAGEASAASRLPGLTMLPGAGPSGPAGPAGPAGPSKVNEVRQPSWRELPSVMSGGPRVTDPALPTTSGPRMGTAQPAQAADPPWASGRAPRVLDSFGTEQDTVVAPPPTEVIAQAIRSKSSSTPPPLGEARARSKSSPSSPPPLGDARARSVPSSPPSVSSPSQPTMLASSPALQPTLPALQPAASVLPPPVIESSRPRGPDDPPPTRIHRPEALADRPFTPPSVSPIPEIPEPGLINSARYAIRFWRARWQRRGAIKTLGTDIKRDTDALDQVLGALGGVARTAKVDGRVFSGENSAITAAEERVALLTREHNDVDARKAEENSKFVDVERERNTKLGEAERMVEEAQKELAQLETQRRNLRDKRKELERRQKAYLKAAEDDDRRSGNTELGDARADLRRSAEQNRREAAALEPERQDNDRKFSALERPISEATAKLDAAKAELDAAKRSLADAREGHTHRLDELDAEQKRKAREIAQAEAEIARRLVTLGTLVNLNRVEDPQFAELYQRIDRLRGAITARTTEIEKLTAERGAYDRGNVVRGAATIGGAILLFIMLIAILRAVLN